MVLIEVTQADFDNDVNDSSSVARQITCSVFEHAVQLTEALCARALLVYADALPNRGELAGAGLLGRVIRVVKTDAEQEQHGRCGAPIIRVPNVPLTRMGQIKIALFQALSRGLVAPGDVVVGIAGSAGSGHLDNLIVVHIGLDFEMFTMHPQGLLPQGVEPDVVERVVDIACELGNSGREGKPIGALFVIGDSERVLSLSRQLILNPFHGYSEDERHLKHADLEETLKELSAVDGAFVIRGNGVIETCGAHIRTSESPPCDLPHGLGTRHHAAAEITAVTDSIAIAVSESAGAVTIFRGGKIMTVIKKPRAMR